MSERVSDERLEEAKAVASVMMHADGDTTSPGARLRLDIILDLIDARATIARLKQQLDDADWRANKATELLTSAVREAYQKCARPHQQGHPAGMKGITTRSLEAVLHDWNDLVSGLCLLRMGPSGPADDLVARATWHMETKQVGGMEHVCALMLADLMVSGKALDFAQMKWAKLSQEWHRDFCPDEACVARRNGEDEAK